MKDKEKVKQGKRNKINGAKFELLVRKDLESNGWIVSKWNNNVSEVFEQDIGEYVRELIPARHKFNPYKKIMTLGTGFPDFECHRKKIINSSEIEDIQKLKEYIEEMNLYEVIGVEAKTNGYLDKEEKLKLKWLLDKQIFSKIMIASKEGKEIKYKEFKNER
ncbi:MAG: hypothetical protein WC758_07470 [Candidatus Woesearchaeota archaeon]|jgi:hypothetical protein